MHCSRTLVSAGCSAGACIALQKQIENLKNLPRRTNKQTLLYRLCLLFGSRDGFSFDTFVACKGS